MGRRAREHRHGNLFNRSILLEHVKIYEDGGKFRDRKGDMNNLKDVKLKLALI